MAEAKREKTEKDRVFAELNGKSTASSSMASNAEKEETKLKAEIETDTKKSEALKANQAKWDKRAKRGLMAGTTILGAVTGGLLAPVASFSAVAAAAGMGAVAGAAADKGILATGNALKVAGEADQKIFSSGNIKQINEAGKNLGDFDDNTILTKLDDTSLKKFDKMAVELEAIKRGIVGLDKAETIKRSILEKTALNGKNDKKVESIVDGALFKNNKYVELSKSYQDLGSNDATEQSRAEKSWQEMIKERRYKMKDLSANATDKLMKTIVETLDDFGSFESQYEEAKKEGKGGQVVEALKKFVATAQGPNKEKGQEYLAKISGINTAYTDSATGRFDSNGASKFIKKLGYKELERMFEKNDKKLQQIVTVVGGQSQMLSASVQNYINNNPNGQALKSALGIS